jgi:DNA repair exonuclease SbcCD ATPase subunit
MEQALSNRIAVFRNGRSRIEQQLENERLTITRLTNKIERIKDESAQLVKAVALIDRCIEVISANGIGKIESIVSGGLHQVFKDKTLGLVVEKKETARGYSYRLLIRHGDTVGNPMESFGGGVQNVAAFLLRVILIKRFKLAKLLVVDESFNNVSVDYIDYITNVSAMLKTLAETHGYTILAVTHQPKLAEAAKNIYEVTPSKPPVLRKRDYVSISEEGAVVEADKAEIA